MARDAEIAMRRTLGADIKTLCADYGIAASTVYGIIAGQGVIGTRGRKRAFRFCQAPGCGEPIWKQRNSKYCSEACWRAVQTNNRGGCIVCGGSLANKRNEKYCSAACYHQALRESWAQAMPVCAMPGCSNQVKKTSNTFCSNECSRAFRRRNAFTGNPCAAPGCSRFTDPVNGKRAKYCSAECKWKMLRVPGGHSEIKAERAARRLGRKCPDCGVSMEDQPLQRIRCEPCVKERLRVKQRAYDKKRRAKKKKTPPSEVRETAGPTFRQLPGGSDGMVAPP